MPNTFKANILEKDTPVRGMHAMEHHCAVCGKRIGLMTRSKKYCGKECKRVAYTEKYRENRLKSNE